MSITITATNFLNDIVNAVDTISMTFVKNGYKAIVSDWRSTFFINTLVTLFVVYNLVQVQHQKQAVSEMVVNTTKLCIVLTLATNWDVFEKVIYNVVTNYPIYLSKTLVEQMGLSSATSTDVSLNDLFSTGMSIAMKVLRSMSLSIKGIILTLFAAAFVVVATILFTLYGLLLIILSKFVLAVLLVLAPVFIACYLFSASKGMTQSWVQAVLCMMFIPILVGCVSYLSLTLGIVVLEPLKTQEGANFSNTLIYLLTSLIGVYLLKQVRSYASSLTSSIAMGGGGGLAAVAGSAIGGVKSALKGGSNVKQGISNAREGFANRQAQLQKDIQQRNQKRTNAASSYGGVVRPKQKGE